MIDFFDFCSEMLCIADSRGYFTKVNDAWTRTLGWSTEELTSRPYVEFVHPEDIEATFREASLLQREDYEVTHFRNRYLCKDGSYKWLAWKAKKRPDSTDLVAAARDVTDEQAQVEALRASEDRFRTLVSHAQIGIALADTEGNTTFHNERILDILHVDEDQLAKLNWQQIMHPGDREWFLPLWRKYLQEGMNMPPQEIRMRQRDRMYRWVSCAVSILRDADGRTTGQIATIEDIHDRKTSELHLRAIIDQAPLGIATLDGASGRFLEMNSRYAEILGILPEDAPKHDFKSVTHPDDIPTHLEELDAQLLGGKQQFRMEKRYIRSDGQIRWVDLTVVPLYDRPEEPLTQHLAIVEDISERKRAEEKLETKEAQLAGLLDNSPSVVYLKDRQGSYLLVNLQFEIVCGLKVEEVLGRTDFELFPEETAKALTNADAEVWRTQQPSTFEETVNHGTVPHVYRSVKFPLVDKRGQMVAMGGVSTDISDLKDAYDNLALKERLLRNLIEVQEQEKQTICHDFHDGLMQYVVGSMMALESLRERLSDTHGETVDRVIKNLRQGVEDGRRVIQGIRPAVLDDLGLEAAIEDLIEQLPTGDGNIQVEIDADPDIDPLSKECEAAAFRVVQEAINNVRKHSGSDRAKVTIRQQDEFLLVDVQDFGCGFEPTSARHTGFGLLGMTERVRLLGGECRIRSKRGSGTTISVRLPIRAGAPD